MTLLRPDRLVLVLVALTLGASSARAEDFTGFYAGVNAGYAFDRDRHEKAAPNAAPTAPSAASDAGDLPPSALTASQSAAMHGARTERPAQR